MRVKTVVKQRGRIRWNEEGKAGKGKKLLKETTMRRCRVECSGDVNEIEALNVIAKSTRMFQNRRLSLV